MCDAYVLQCFLVDRIVTKGQLLSRTNAKMQINLIKMPKFENKSNINKFHNNMFSKFLKNASFPQFMSYIQV